MKRTPADTDMILYPILGQTRILCTARVLWCAIRDGMYLFYSILGTYYWSTRPRAIDDTFIAQPRDFWTRSGIEESRARAASPTDYFLLH